jgi:5'-nucleotidase
MATDLSDTLVVGIAATALFDLRESDAFFQQRMAADPATALQA